MQWPALADGARDYHFAPYACYRAKDEYVLVRLADEFTCGHAKVVRPIRVLVGGALACDCRTYPTFLRFT